MLDGRQICVPSGFCVYVYLAIHKMTVIPHPAYWQGSVLCEFFLYEEVKVSFKCRRFSMIQAKLHNMLAIFQTMHLWKCLEQQCDKWTCCINSKETTWRAALIGRVRAVCDGEINPVQRQITYIQQLSTSVILCLMGPCGHI